MPQESSHSDQKEEEKETSNEDSSKSDGGGDNERATKLFSHKGHKGSRGFVVNLCVLRVKSSIAAERTRLSAHPHSSDLCSSIFFLSLPKIEYSSS